MRHKTAVISARKFSQRLLLLLVFALLVVPSVEAVFRVKKTPQVPTPLAAKPTFASEEEEQLYRLRQGEVLIEGGYQGRAVWGKMVGLVQAPPETVWKIFIHPDRWTFYHFPGIIDARTVTEKITVEVEDNRRVKNFYKVLGSQVFDPDRFRRSGGTWPFYVFQFYKVPWPVENKWMILKATNDETRIGEGIYRAEWMRGAGNVRTVDGYLLLKPFAGNKNQTWLEYRAISDPGSHIPRFLVRWGLEREMPAVVRKIREIAEHPATFSPS